MSPLISGLASVASLIFNAAFGGSAKSAVARRAEADAAPQASTVISLSPQAEALAGLAGNGVAQPQGRPHHALGIRSAPQSSEAGLLARRSVSTEDFQTLLNRFGADDAQKAQLTAGFDANQDGAITQAEFLQGLAKTKGDQAGSGFSQAVMGLMDRCGVADGKVAETEFAAFASAFTVAADKRSGLA